MNKNLTKKVVSLGLSLVMASSVATVALASHSVNDRAVTTATYKIAKPYTPRLASATNDTKGVVVKWNAVKGAVNYRVYRKTANKKWKYIANTKSTTYVDRAVKNDAGVDYVYTVRAENASGLSGYNTKGLTVKRVPTPHLNSIISSNAGIMVGWTEIENATFYRVYRKIDNGSWKYLGKVDTNSYIDVNLKKSPNHYTYTVRAEIKGVYGDYEEGVRANFLKVPTVSKPHNIDRGITFSWNEISGASFYRVYRRTTRTTWKLMGVTTATTYVDTLAKADSGVEYFYTVRAYNGTLSSYNSTVGVSRVIAPHLTKVTNSATAGVDVQWEQQGDADCFRIYRKVNGSNWKLIKETKDAERLVYTDKTAVPGKTYTYTVRAILRGSLSSYENGLSITL